MTLWNFVSFFAASADCVDHANSPKPAFAELDYPGHCNASVPLASNSFHHCSRWHTSPSRRGVQWRNPCSGCQGDRERQGQDSRLLSRWRCSKRSSGALHAFNLKAGDQLKPHQLSLGDARSYYVTTARNDLGVIFATSEAGQSYPPPVIVFLALIALQEQRCNPSRGRR